MASFNIPIPLELRSILNRNSEVILNADQPAAPSDSQNVSWQTDEFGNLSASVAAHPSVSLVVTVSADSSPINFAPGAFNIIPLPSVVEDTAGGWDTGTNKYTVPVTGTYLIITKWRLTDNITPGISYGLGVNTSAVDGPWFEWFVTVAAPVSGNGRQGALNTRIVHLNAGDQIFMYGYADNSGDITYIEGALDLSLVSVP